MSIFKKNCKENNQKFPEELEQKNSVDYIKKFPDFINKKNIKSKYIGILMDTLEEFSTSENIKKKLEDDDLIIDLEIKQNKDMSMTEIQKILSKIFDPKNLSLKDKIILKLRQIFKQEIESDNNRVFNKINIVLKGIDKFEKNDKSIKTKILYALYQGESEHKDDPNYKASNRVGGVNPEQELQNSKEIEAKNEIIKNKNDLNTNIKRCILAGYSVHICQYQKEMPEGQEGGGWWPFSFGKGKEDNPNENYVNCFPKHSTIFTTMFEENQDNTFVNFKNRKKKYIIYNTLTSARKKKKKDEPTYMANIITIIPEKIINEFRDIIPTNNGQCSVESRMR